MEAASHRVGRLAVHPIFAPMAILLYSSFSKAFLLPARWTLVMAFPGLAMWLPGVLYGG